MCQRSWFSALLALCLLANAFCVPATLPRMRRQSVVQVDEVRTDNSTNQISADEEDDDFDEPSSASDGGGGGSNLSSLLNIAISLLPSLSGSSTNEDGQSDLGSLLATVSGIIANLSGDGIDLNSLIASGIGLFVGLLSEGEENPGTVIASYLLTSLDTITGGGAKNNGAFFGKFLSKLVKGTSAANQEGSQESQGSSPFGILKLDILRALFQFATSMLGLFSSQASSMG